MSRKSALAVFVVAGLLVPANAYAQFTPLAGSAGAGGSAISGVPFGPANPSALSDPSGIGNASRMPPLTPNQPAPPTSYGAIDTSSPPRARVVTPPYAAGASQRIVSGRQLEPKKPPVRRRGRAEVSTFQGICRGC